MKAANKGENMHAKTVMNWQKIQMRQANNRHDLSIVK